LIADLRKKFPEYEKEKVGFAGRLDPLAHGVMLLTIGDANKNRDQYLNLSKTYRFSVLFGVETDTYDYLGILKSFEIEKIPTVLEKKINLFINENTGKLQQPYPPFSSKTLNGIPLYKLAKRNKLKNSDLPLRAIEVFKFNLIAIQEKSSSEIKTEFLKNLKRIKGYFRQTKITKQWEDFFKENTNSNFTLANFEVRCSSGTYVRSLANKLGQQLKTGAIAFEILRTKVGDYTLEESIRL